MTLEQYIAEKQDEAVVIDSLTAAGEYLTRLKNYGGQPTIVVQDAIQLNEEGPNT